MLSKADRMSPTIHSLRRDVPIIWGNLDRVEEDIIGTRWVYVRTTMTGSEAFRLRARVGRQVVVIRGIERIDFSCICTGEFVEVTYHQCHSDFVEVDTIYVRPKQDQVAE